MRADQISQVRRFNRLVTQRAGALNDHFLGRDHPLGESRLLYEIGPGGADLCDLRQRLGLDSGYVSRLVNALFGSRESIRQARRPDGASINTSASWTGASNPGSIPPPACLPTIVISPRLAARSSSRRWMGSRSPVAR
jgi:hypothetical protein